MTITQDTSFTAWVQEWAQLANYRGPILADPETRMRRLLDLWDQPIPGKWHRPITNTPSRLLGGRRYTRDDEASPRNGEHRIEKEILSGNLDSASCLGAQLLDGVNAYPLVCDTGGGRNGNVEADLFLLTKDPTGCRLIIAEVKDSANNTWYAAVENLRQMKLLLSYEDPGELFRQRNPGLQLPAEMPIIGAVIAPQSFYEQNGQKANSVGPALILLRAFRLEKNVDIRFVVWDCGRARLLEFERVSSSLVKNVATELAAPLADRVASMKPAKRALQLKTSPDDALRQISSIPHNRCAKAINDHWHTEVDGGIRAQSALWLFCWAKTGMNSQTAKVVAAEVFDRIMSVSFAEFDNVVNHEYARESRYADRNIEHELAEMVSRIPRRAQ